MIISTANSTKRIVIADQYNPYKALIPQVGKIILDIIINEKKQVGNECGYGSPGISP